jgi:hypothetical protein
MCACTPHCGLDPEARLGGEMYEREILRALGGRDSGGAERQTR